MNKREFIKRSIVGAVAIGASGAGSAAFAETAAKPRKPKTLKKKLGKTGFEVYPVIYGGIVSMQDGQKASDNYVAWASIISTWRPATGMQKKNSDFP